MNPTTYVVEARDETGALDFRCPQPPCRDWTEEDLAALAWRHTPDADLSGWTVCSWLSDNVHPHWRTRVKTW